MSFIQHWGPRAGVKRIKVIPGSEGPFREVEIFDGIVQKDEVDFEVGTPVFEGDQMEWDDPRGGSRKVFVTSVEMRDPPMASAFMRHWSALYSSTPPPAASSASSHGGHVIVVNGSNVNIALDGSSVTQQVPVTAGYESLADAVGRALAVIERTTGVDPEEVEMARESATMLVEESAKPAPDRSAMKRALAGLRGVLGSAASSGAGAAATAIVNQLMLPS
jgi:hypothetical protein